MGEQLTHIALLRIRKPQPGKTVFHQQLENMAGVSLVGLLLANITGSNLGRIPNPQGVSKLFHQQLKPAGIAGGFHANQRRNRQLTIESFRLAAGMHQLLLLHLPGLCVQYCYLLVARVKITAYNLHKAPLLPRSATQVSNPSLVPGPLGPFGLSNQAQRGICSSPSSPPKAHAATPFHPAMPLYFSNRPLFTAALSFLSFRAQQGICSSA